MSLEQRTRFKHLAETGVSLVSLWYLSRLLFSARFNFNSKQQQRRVITEDNVNSIKNDGERRAAQALLRADVGKVIAHPFEVKLDKDERGDLRQQMTIPDFQVNGHCLEVTTSKRGRDPRKPGQAEVMRRAGLPFTQLFGNDLDALEQSNDPARTINDLTGGKIRGKKQG